MAKLSAQGKAFAVERRVAFNSAMDTGAERTEMVFIAAGVTDSDALLAGRTAASEIVWLDADSDGVLQIAAALAGRSGVDSIHIVSHGRAGALPLGTATLSLATLDSYRSELAAIGQALQADGDILLYGCNIAGGNLAAGAYGNNVGTYRLSVEALIAPVGTGTELSDIANGSGGFVINGQYEKDRSGARRSQRRECRSGWRRQRRRSG